MEEWDLDVKNITSAWDNRGDIVIGNDVWIGYEAVVLAGVHIGDSFIRMVVIYILSSIFQCRRKND